MMVHKHAAGTNPKKPKKVFPVSTIRVHPWLHGYIGNPAVEFVDGNTVFVWNSPEHKRLMNRSEVMR